MADERKRRFIAALLPYAQETATRTGIPASFTLAMAANETGWNADNPVLFGIKGRSPSGRAARFATWEVGPKGRYDTEAEFATYKDAGEAFAHLIREMGTARYQQAPRTSARAFAGYLQKRGWATDPEYASKIERLASEVEGMMGAPAAGQNYQALGASGATAPAARPGAEPPTGGGPTMPEPTPPTTGQGQGDYRQQSVQAIKDYIAELEQERKGLQAEYKQQSDLLRRTGYNPAAEAELLRLRSEIGAVNTALRQAHASLAQAQRVTANAPDDELRRRQVAVQEQALANDMLQQQIDAEQKRIQNEIATGRLSLDQGKARWDQVLDSATTAMTQLQNSYALLQRASGSMGTPELGQAAWDTLRNWEGLVPGLRLPEKSPLPMIPFDPVGAIKPYLPPPPSAQQWQQAMMTPREEPQPRWMQDAMTGVAGGLGRATAPGPAMPPPGPPPIEAGPEGQGLDMLGMPPRAGDADLMARGALGGMPPMPPPPMPPEPPAGRFQPPPMDQAEELRQLAEAQGVPPTPPPPGPAIAREILDIQQDPSMAPEEKRRRIEALLRGRR